MTTSQAPQNLDFVRGRVISIDITRLDSARHERVSEWGEKTQLRYEECHDYRDRFSDMARSLSLFSREWSSNRLAIGLAWLLTWELRWSLKVMKVAFIVR